MCCFLLRKWQKESLLWLMIKPLPFQLSRTPPSTQQIGTHTFMLVPNICSTKSIVFYSERRPRFIGTASTMNITQSYPLGHSWLTFRPAFHLFTCMHAFARLIASYHTVKVHDITTEHCAPISAGKSSPFLFTCRPKQKWAPIVLRWTKSSNKIL